MKTLPAVKHQYNCINLFNIDYTFIIQPTNSGLMFDTRIHLPYRINKELAYKQSNNNAPFQ